MNRWEDFARENAEFYILTDAKVDYSTPEGQEYFFRSGQEHVRKTMELIREYLTATDLALEIGCGIGRLVLPHAEIFAEVRGVDISKTMLNKLRAQAQARGKNNIRTFLPDESWDQPASLDYIYSFIVFQHIENFGIIESYLRRAALALKARGVALFQFDTRPQTFLYRLRNALPDFLLPATYRQGIRRIRRSPPELEKLFRETGLQVIKEFASGTHEHLYLLRKNETLT